MPKPKAGIIYNDIKPIACKVALDIEKKLTASGWQVHLATGVGGILEYSTPGSPVCNSRIEQLTPPNFDSEMAFAVILGGDGTILAAARQLAPKKIPILAVNVGGHLGFLTEPFELFQETEAIWERLQSDLYAVQKRMMLEAQLFEGSRTKLTPVSEKFYCLNEMCIKPASIDRMPTSILEMEADGQLVDQYSGDGLLVSTPTGSTGYTVSANGPILHPGMWAIAVTPICPLSLSGRPLVLPPGSVVSISPLRDYELNTKLWTDGALGATIWPGQRVVIKMANCQAHFIILRESYSFYDTLREKLQWAGTRVHYENRDQ